MRTSSVALQESVLLDFELPNLASLAAEQELMVSDWFKNEFNDLRSKVAKRPPQDDLEEKLLETLVDEIIAVPTFDGQNSVTCFIKV